MCSANVETTIAMSIDSSVTPRSYAISIGSISASMPTKCIAQIPMPIATPPPTSHAGAACLLATRMRNANVNAV